jgi:hypothetical protein
MYYKSIMEICNINRIYCASERTPTMKLSRQVKPLSYLKARAPEVIRGLAASREPMIITVNGEAKAVMQGVASYEERRRPWRCSSCSPFPTRMSMRAGRDRSAKPSPPSAGV